jgi:hypothetical protein
MTVRTSNIALRDLEEYSIPRLVGRQDYTVVSFETGIAMIEVKNDDVGLPAVDAWMSPEVLADQGRFSSRYRRILVTSCRMFVARFRT